MISLLSVLGTLAVVIVGMLLMLQVLRWEAIGKWILQALFVVIAALTALFLVRCAVLPILISWLVWLREKLLWCVALGFVLTVAVIAMTFRKAQSGQHGKNEE